MTDQELNEYSVFARITSQRLASPHRLHHACRALAARPSLPSHTPCSYKHLPSSAPIVGGLSQL